MSSMEVHEALEGEPAESGRHALGALDGHLGSMLPSRMEAEEAVEESAPEIDLRKRNSAVLCGVVAALLSLPLRWMTLRDAQVTVRGDGFPREFAAGFGSLMPATIELSGMNGHLFEGALPFWGLALLVVLANLLLLVRRSRHLYVPEAVPPVLALGVTGLTLVPLLATGSAKATLGPGWVLCFVAILVPLVYLFRQRALVVAWREERRRRAPEPG